MPLPSWQWGRIHQFLNAKIVHLLSRIYSSPLFKTFSSTGSISCRDRNLDTYCSTLTNFSAAPYIMLNYGRMIRILEVAITYRQVDRDPGGFHHLYRQVDPDPGGFRHLQYTGKLTCAYELVSFSVENASGVIRRGHYRVGRFLRRHKMDTRHDVPIC